MQELLNEAIEAWNGGDHYEAHEKLEDVVDLLDDDDGAQAIALALVRVAASLHKLVNDVGKSAVPAKLKEALETLRRAPPAWNEIDLRRLVADLDRAMPAIERLEVPADLPKLYRVNRLAE